jgi:hypothetical protein
MELEVFFPSRPLKLLFNQSNLAANERLNFNDPLIMRKLNTGLDPWGRGCGIKRPHKSYSILNFFVQDVSLLAKSVLARICVDFFIKVSFYARRCKEPTD